MKDARNMDNEEGIFSLQMSDSFITVDNYIMDSFVKSMLPTMQDIDLEFMQEVRRRIAEQCQKYGVDKKFCFQEDTKRKFEIMDKQNRRPEVEK